ncbi:MAG TPA: DUF262 domain-containing protein [Chthoniobacterales bacterium]|nr:DUF262 domain-containing protein [Chthoniobacterales bacterium]
MDEELREQKIEYDTDVGDSLQALEEKYKEQMRQIISQKIELPIATLVGMIGKQIKLNPEFQRRDRWDVERQSRFIESIIMNVPVPPVFLGEETYGGYTVLDGRQRLTALYEFLRNSYPLKGLKVWAELNKSNIRELEKKGIDVMLLRRFLPAVVILKESSPQVKYDVFDRLNTGGVVANAMEIRNAVYPGRFNSHIHTLSDEPSFRRLWNIPLDNQERLTKPLYSKMYDLELVLRFFALRDAQRMDLTFKDFLSDFMHRRNGAYQADPSLEAADTSMFLRTADNVWKVFGEDAFQKPGSKIKSAPLADGIMQALADIQPESLDASVSDRIRRAILKAYEADPAFQKAISTGTNGKGAITTRIDTAKRVVAAAVDGKDYEPDAIASK